MPVLKENAFTFVSKALPENTFTVARFSGEEGLSMLYRFEILLVSELDDVDLSAVLQNPATLTVKGMLTGGEDLPFHGILSAFEQMHQADGYVFYRAELRPKVWWLTLTHHNQVFLNKSPDQFLAEVLQDGGPPGSTSVSTENPILTFFPGGPSSVGPITGLNRAMRRKN